MTVPKKVWQECPADAAAGRSPRLTLLDRQVGLGSGFADLLAMESTSRLAIIEVKLAGNVHSS